MAAQREGEREVEELMNESFGDPRLAQPEVTVAIREGQGPTTFDKAWENRVKGRDVRQSHIDSLPRFPPRLIDRGASGDIPLSYPSTASASVMRGRDLRQSREASRDRALSAPGPRREAPEILVEDEEQLRPKQRQRTSPRRPSPELVSANEELRATHEPRLQALELLEVADQTVHLKLEKLELTCEVVDLQEKLIRAEGKITELADQALRSELEKLQLTSEVADLQEKLIRAEGKITELAAANVDLNTSRDEAIATQLSIQDELEYCKSENFKKHIINDFKSSPDYHEAIGREAGSFLDKGCIHMIRQLHPFFEDKSVLLRAFQANFDNEACRQGADFVPFTKEEMEALRNKDEKRGRLVWTPPPPTEPTFWDMLGGPSSSGA